jgi:sulfite reductase (NADPH) flavoprotein alpha-component
LNFLVAFSAADVEARVSTVDGGTLVLEPGRRRRLNELIEEPGCARALWELMRNEADGGTGASFYICGRADFAASIHRSLKAIIARSSGITDDPTAGDYASRMIAKMTADGRLMQDVFTTYSGAYQDGVRSFDASDIVLHNNPDQGYWMVVSGRVYDVGEFMNLHPGGNRILREYAGLDATHAFQAVLHHRNTDVDALLGLYEIGVMRRLDFKANWGVAVGPGGLFYTPHEEAFRCWVRFLYLIVEMENALANDVSFLDQALTYQEDGGRRTPQKFQLLLDTHQRFLSSYLAGLTGDELQRLWAITAGLCRPDADVRTLRMRLDAVVASGEATFVRDAPAAWWRDVLQRLLEDADFIAQDALRALCDVIERHDRRLLAELKMVVREGVKVFEQQQEQAITAGGELLYDRINALSAVIARYFSDLAQALRGLDHPNSIGPTIDDVARSRDESGTTPSRFPGHGSAVGAATQRPEGRS